MGSMSEESDLENRPHEALVRVYHEPLRLAMMSALAGEKSGLSFVELKELLDATDGNLNRHLKVLADAGAIRTEKVLAEGRARTMVRLTVHGRRSFLSYLDSLESVLKTAATNLRRAVPDSATVNFETA